MPNDDFKGKSDRANRTDVLAVGAVGAALGVERKLASRGHAQRAAGAGIHTVTTTGAKLQVDFGGPLGSRGHLALLASDAVMDQLP